MVDLPLSRAGCLQYLNFGSLGCALNLPGICLVYDWYMHPANDSPGSEPFVPAVEQYSEFSLVLSMQKPQWNLHFVKTLSLSLSLNREGTVC